MTETTDPVSAFRHALGRDLDTRLNLTQTVTGLVHTAVRDQHWTPTDLARECSRDLADVVNAGAVITSRLRKAAEHPPVARAAKVPGALLPWCSDDCKSRAGWLENEDGNPTSRCPCRTPKKATA